MKQNITVVISGKSKTYSDSPERSRRRLESLKHLMPDAVITTTINEKGETTITLEDD